MKQFKVIPAKGNPNNPTDAQSNYTADFYIVRKFFEDGTSEDIATFSNSDTDYEDAKAFAGLKNSQYSPDHPEVVITVDAGKITGIESTRGDIEFTIIDKDMGHSLPKLVEKRSVDQIMMGKREAIKRIVGARQYLDLKHHQVY